MALFNYASKEITLKVVYYGPGLSGKTTNLQYLHSNLDQARQSKLLSLATETDRTLFFDFLPMDLGKIGGFKVKFQLYTVPGQVRYDATRKLVLKGADAVVFIADSQRAMRDSNKVSIENMEENLAANNLDPNTILLVLQYNKRDLPDIMPVEEMNKDLNRRGVTFIEASAVKGKGVDETFQEITRLLVQETSRRQKMYAEGKSNSAAKAIQTKVGPARMGVRPAAAEAKPVTRTRSRPGSEVMLDENSFGGMDQVEDTFNAPIEKGVRKKVRPDPDPWAISDPILSRTPTPSPPPPPPPNPMAEAEADESGDIGSLRQELLTFIKESKEREEEILWVLNEMLNQLRKL